MITWTCLCPLSYIIEDLILDFLSVPACINIQCSPSESNSHCLSFCIWSSFIVTPCGVQLCCLVYLYLRHQWNDFMSVVWFLSGDTPSLPVGAFASSSIGDHSTQWHTVWWIMWFWWFLLHWKRVFIYCQILFNLCSRFYVLEVFHFVS